MIEDCRVKGTINISTILHGYTLPPGLRHFSLYFNALALFCYDLAGEVEFSRERVPFTSAVVLVLRCVGTSIAK